MTKRNWAKVQKTVSALPGAEEVTSYGTPGFRIGKKFFCRLREDGETLALRMSIDEREMLIEREPKVYFVTDHYRAYPAVLVNLKLIRADALRALLERCWREVASAKLIKAREAQAKES